MCVCVCVCVCVNVENKVGWQSVIEVCQLVMNDTVQGNKLIPTFERNVLLPFAA